MPCRFFVQKLLHLSWFVLSPSSPAACHRGVHVPRPFAWLKCTEFAIRESDDSKRGIHPTVVCLLRIKLLNRWTLVILYMLSASLESAGWRTVGPIEGAMIVSEIRTLLWDIQRLPVASASSRRCRSVAADWRSKRSSWRHAFNLSTNRPIIFHKYLQALISVSFPATLALWVNVPNQPPAETKCSQNHVKMICVRHAWTSYNPS